MHRCHVGTNQLLADTCLLPHEEARHLQTVLRVKINEQITLFDGHGNTRLVRIIASSKQGLQYTAEAPLIQHPRPSCRITLFACISKGNRMEWTVEKAVELGVAQLVPVISARTIVRCDPTEDHAKSRRWQRIAAEAGRQCGATWLPTITPPTAFQDCLAQVQQTAPVFIASLAPQTPALRTILTRYTQPPPCAGLFVGPEGDFTAAELEALCTANAISVNFGSQILRAETACLYGLCVLNHAWLA